MSKRTPRQVLRTLKRNALEAETRRFALLTPEQMVQEARDAGINVEHQAREADEWLAKLERGEIVPSTQARRVRQEREAPKATQPVPPLHEVGDITATGGLRGTHAYRRWAMVLTIAAAATTATTLAGPALMVAMRDPAPRHELRGLPALSPTVENAYARRMTPTPRADEERVAMNVEPHAMGAAHARPDSAPNADRLREAAFMACDQSRWADCVDALDRAKRIDPSGDRQERVQRYRQRARAGLQGGL